MLKRLLKNFAIGLAMLCFLMGPGTLYAQERIVSGTVSSSEDGSVLPGVNVIVKGTTIGTATDATGRYSIAVPSTGRSLIFSFIGLQTSEVEIGDRTTIDIALTLDVTQLSEIVVTSMGIERDKKSLGYSVTQLDNDELTVARTTNIANALSGKIPGVRIQSSNGMVGAGASIFIRGFTTFTQSNQPLFVIDGIPMDNSGGIYSSGVGAGQSTGGSNALQTGVTNSNRAIDLNQDDIESITVLKGPSAAALYGSRAASGAILITTKKGAKGKSMVTYSGSYAISEVNRLPELQNEYAQGANGVFNPLQDFSWGPQITGQTVTNFLGQPEVLQAYPDNVKDLFQQGANQQHSISFSGGSDRGNFMFSYGNLRETGIMQNNELERNNFRTNVNTTLTEKLTMGTSIQYIASTSQRTQQGNQLANPLFRGYFTPRSYNLSGYPFEDAAGNQVFYGTADNPYWSLKYNTWNDQIDRFIGNANFNYDFNDWISASYKIGIDNFTQIVKAFDAIGSKGQVTTSAGGVGAVRDQTTVSRLVTSFLNLTMKRDLTQDLKATLLLGNEMNSEYGNFQDIVGQTAAIQSFDNIGNTTTYFPTGVINRRRLIGVYGNLTLGFRDFVTLDLTGRNDWSSTFNKEQRSFFYPSAALSIDLTNAFPSIKGNVLTFSKLKTNVTKVGRQAPIYATNTNYFGGSAGDGFGPNIAFPFGGLNGFTFANAAGLPTIGPEFTTNFEVGAEIKLFKSRVGFDVTAFNQRTTDIILSVPVSVASGHTSTLRNAGELESKGIELLVTGTPLKIGQFTWDISVNYTKIKNTVVALADGVPVITLGGFTSPNTRLEAGKPYGIIYGSYFLRDTNGNLIINSAGEVDLAAGTKQIGDPNPDWTGGITNTFDWKGLSISFLIDIRKGGDIISRTVGDLLRSGAAKETAEFPRFNPDGTPTTPYVIPGVKADGTPNDIAIRAERYWGDLYAFGTGESYIFDASWVRLREASISYAFPKSLLAKVKMGSAQIGLNGRNLFLHTPNIKHIDPETNAQGVGNSQGLEFNTLPQTRQYGVFLKLTF